jgi:seryl-tRNA synthetase
MESASREMRERLKECREKHHDLIESLRTTNARQATEMAKLKHTVSEQQEQLSSLKVQLDNMDNSDLLIVNNPNDAEELQVELSKASNENKELERRYGEMMSYIE